jgi:hypothetical protein
MGTYSKYRFVNTGFGGTGGIVLPTGTTGQRPGGTPFGTLRYNSQLNLAENYNGAGWQAIDSPPTVGSVSGVIAVATNATLTITGSNFKNGSIVSIEGAGVGGIARQLVTTYVSSSQLTAATNAASVNYTGNALYDIKVTNPSGLAGTLSPAGTVDREPIWSTAQGTIAQIYSNTAAVAFSVVATDADAGDTLTYTVTSGTLPSGINLSTAGQFTGTAPSVGSDTTYTFNVTATDTKGYGLARQFSIIVLADATVSSASPNPGNVASTVTLSGSNFRSGISSVTLGSTSGISFSVGSSSSGTFTMPLDSGTLSIVNSGITTNSVTQNGKTYSTINLSRNPYAQPFNFSGAQQTWTVPTGVTSVTVKVWGGGGATGGSAVQTWGGASGFSSGTLSVSSGQSYPVIVGGGGSHSRNAAVGGGFGGGGGSGNPQGYEGASSGGGYSGVFFQNVSFGNARIMAGGGGGGAGCGNTGGYANNTGQSGFGGSGGGSSGQASSGTYSGGGGGSQSGGGSALGGGAPGQNGGQLSGGFGNGFLSSPNHSSGGGGGGGYYGGAGGRGGEGGITAGDAGGGGSGYTGGVSGASSSNGQGSGQFDSNGGRPAPPSTGDSNYNGSAGYGGYTRAGGQNGYVVIII